MDSDKYILLTIDVEDWFQVENFKPWIPFETWDQCELRVEKNTHALLNLFDSVELAGKLEARGQEAKNKHYGKQTVDKEHSEDLNRQPSSLPAFQPQAQKDDLKGNGQRTTGNGHTKKVRATFFVLGWLAERLPNLVREIYSRGHEVASHGYGHNISTLSPMENLRTDLSKSKNLIEDIIGDSVYGYRAPNFSIDKEILKMIQDCGYLYDSSYNSFRKHQRYGHIDLGENVKNGIAAKISDSLYELPISNLTLGNRIFPWGGGAYFRLIP